MGKVVYTQVKDGDVVHPEMKGYKLCCCDCGAIHTLDFFIVHRVDERSDGSYRPIPFDAPGLQVAFSVVKDNRATATKRQWKRKKGWKGVK